MACTNLVTYFVQKHVMNNCLIEARSAFEIRWCDRRNFKELREYILLAIPSFLILVLEWSSSEIITILSGNISKRDQAMIIIQLSFSATTSTSALGLGVAASALVGKQIGNNNVYLAKKYAVGVMVIGVFYSIIECSILSLHSDNLIRIITSDPAIQAIVRNLFWLFLFFLTLDKWQIALSGVIRGIGKQGSFTVICLVSYFPLQFIIYYTLVMNVGWHTADYGKYSLL